jgi:hypothetical protein
VGKGIEPALRVGDADHPEQVERPFARRPLLHPAVQLEDLRDLLADVPDRVQ